MTDNNKIFLPYVYIDGERQNMIGATGGFISNPDEKAGISIFSGFQFDGVAGALRFFGGFAISTGRRSRGGSS